MLKILVDPEDKWLLDAEPWRLAKSSSVDGVAYAAVGRKVNGKFCQILMHRLIMNAPDGVLVDHINGDGLDNRKSNLRLCDHSENMRNRRLAKSNKVGLKGVYRDGNSFRAEIKCDGIKHRLGSFSTPEAAHDAYKKAALKLHKEFARFA